MKVKPFREPKEPRWKPPLEDFSVRSANGEWCEYISLDECAAAEHDKFAAEVKTRERVDAMQFVDCLDDGEQQTILGNLVGIPLTDACNGRCKFCSVCARPGIKKQFTWDSAVRLVKKFNHASRQTDFQKSQILFYYNTDQLDWEETDDSGNVVHDSHDLARFVERKHRTTKTAGVTHLPPHGINGLLKQMSDELAFAVNNIGVATYPLNISITDDNADLIAKFRDRLIRDVIKKCNVPEEYVKEAHANLYQETERLFYDRRKPGMLSHIGWNYPGDHVPVQDLILQQPFAEGVYIDPNGIESVIHVLPTEENKTGTIQMPYSATGKVFKRIGCYTRSHIASTLSENILDHSEPAILPSLRNSIVGNPEDLAGGGGILTPRNELLREAFAWRNFECSIIHDRQKLGTAKFESELAVSDTLAEMRTRLYETIEILNRTHENDARATEYLEYILNEMSRLIARLESNRGISNMMGGSVMSLFGGLSG